MVDTGVISSVNVSKIKIIRDVFILIVFIIDDIFKGYVSDVFNASRDYDDIFNGYVMDSVKGISVVNGSDRDGIVK